jgi:hypothetical protein
LKKLAKAVLSIPDIGIEAKNLKNTNANKVKIILFLKTLSSKTSFNL